MFTTVSTSPFRPLDGRLQRGATVIVAADGAEQSDGALRIALARAGEMHATPEIVAIVTPDPVMAPEMSFALWTEASRLRRAALREAVEAQVERATGQPRVHPVTLLEGHPASTIARVAIERRAALVVVGLGRHQVVDRLFSDETALQLARISRVPVLAVPNSAYAVPRHAIVAVDFSDLSLRAAQAAVEAVSDEGRVDLVHVMPYVSEDPFAIEGTEPYQQWVEAQLAALADRLVVPPGVVVTRTAVRGRPAPELLAHVRETGADLVVAGSHGHGFVARAFLGSVTTKLIRAATCSVLTVPRDPLPSFTTRPDVVPPPAREDEWPALLDAFTRRNLGRRTILEADDLEIGAQAQDYNYPFVGALYDLHDRRLQITLGDRTLTGRRLTRSVGGIAGVEILSDGHEHDSGLRVEHGTSQTLLTFTP